MRQLIARVDDKLHDDLKARAAAEGRSMNALVNEMLEAALATTDQRRIVWARIRALGLETFPTPIERPLMSRDEVIASTRGSGTAVSEALEADRNAG